MQDKTRQEINIEICELLIEFFSKPENRDLRFFQALSNIGLFNPQFDDQLVCTGVDDPYQQDSKLTRDKIRYLNSQS